MTISEVEHSGHVVTYQSQSEADMDICQLCEAALLALGRWPKDAQGGEFCSVSRGLHVGDCAVTLRHLGRARGRPPVSPDGAETERLTLRLGTAERAELDRLIGAGEAKDLSEAARVAIRRSAERHQGE